MHSLELNNTQVLVLVDIDLIIEAKFAKLPNYVTANSTMYIWYV